jgi:hypothetical protein
MKHARDMPDTSSDLIGIRGSVIVGGNARAEGSLG